MADPDPMLDHLSELVAERIDQLGAGFTPEYDDRRGGVVYLAATAARYCTTAIADPTRTRERLVHAGAVILAALAAYDRADGQDDQ